MKVNVVNAMAQTPQAWRNGGGHTRELLALPPGSLGADWQVRVSLADIAQDGVFSEFAHVQRWFAVVQGQGVELHWPHARRHVVLGTAPLHFEGQDAPDCRLIQGSTQDLNLMVRGVNSTCGEMCVVDAAKPWLTTLARPLGLRGLYTRTPGVWRCGTEQRNLNAHDFLWVAPADRSAWEFDSAGPAWWLAAAPAQETL
jgi:environmental stress-induced protein Ves